MNYLRFTNKKTAPPEKDGTVARPSSNSARTVVSPFDGVNRIRFKGSHSQVTLSRCAAPPNFCVLQDSLLHMLLNYVLIAPNVYAASDARRGLRRPAIEDQHYTTVETVWKGTVSAPKARNAIAWGNAPGSRFSIGISAEGAR